MASYYDDLIDEEKDQATAVAEPTTEGTPGPGPYDDLLPSKPFESAERGLLPETMIAYTRGSMGMAGNLVKTTGDILREAGTRKDANTGLPYQPLGGGALTAVGKAIGKGGQFLREKAASPEFAPTRFGVGGFLANTLGGGAVPSVIGSIVANAIVPGGGIALIGGSETGSFYQDSIAKGDSYSKALTGAVIVGTVNAYLEKLQLDALFKPGYTKAIRDGLVKRAWSKMPTDAALRSMAVATQSVENAIQEMAQGVTPEIVRYLQSGELPDMDESRKDMFAEALAGAAMGVGSGMSSTADVGLQAPPRTTPAAKQPWEMNRNEFEFVYTQDAAKKTVPVRRGPAQRKILDDLFLEGSWERNKTDWSIAEVQTTIRDLSNRRQNKATRSAIDYLTKLFPTSDELRRTWVERALAEGKQIPDEVMADFPDLAVQAGAGTTTPRQATAEAAPAPAVSPELPIEAPGKAGETAPIPVTARQEPETAATMPSPQDMALGALPGMGEAVRETDKAEIRHWTQLPEPVIDDRMIRAWPDWRDRITSLRQQIADLASIAYEDRTEAQDRELALAQLNFDDLVGDFENAVHPERTEVAPWPKPEQAAAKPPAPAPAAVPTPPASRPRRGFAEQKAEIEKRLKDLRGSGMDFAYDMAANDQGAAIRRVEAEVKGLEDALAELIRREQGTPPQPAPTSTPQAQPEPLAPGTQLSSRPGYLDALIEPRPDSGITNRGPGKIQHIRRTSDGREVIKVKGYGEAHWDPKNWQIAATQPPAETPDKQPVLTYDDETIDALHRKLIQTGDVRCGGTDIKIVPTDFGYTVQIARNGVRFTKGAGYNNRWSLDTAQDKARDEIRSALWEEVEDQGAKAQPQETVPEPIDAGGVSVVESPIQEPSYGPIPGEPERTPSGRPHGTPAPQEAPAQPPQVPQEQGPGHGVRAPGSTPRRGVHGQGGRSGQAAGGDVRGHPGDVGEPAGRGRTPRRPSNPGGQLDYRITDADAIEAGGQKTKFNNNVAAIRLLKQIESEGRTATAEEQAILVKYTGWGGLVQAFRSWGEWENENQVLRELLTDEEYEDARASTPNAHFTSPPVVRGIWSGLEQMGFKGGRINEPAIGTGMFYGLIPDGIAASSNLFGVEMDGISARIAKQLYQSASITNKPFQDVRYPDNFFDLFVSNVPFDEQTKPYDPDMRTVKFALHDFYFAKALKKTRPGGLVAFITSKGTMDKVNDTVRKYLAKDADLIGAIRLPRTAFGKIANTEVVTDIIVLQKRKPGTTAQGETWTDTVEHESEGNTFDINEYFANHPENILGKLSYAGSMYRANEMTVEDTGIDLQAKVSEIMGQFTPTQDIHADQSKRDEQMHQSDAQKLAPENVKERAFVMEGGKLYQKIDGILRPFPVASSVRPRFAAMIQVRNAARRLIGLQIDPQSEEADVEKARKELNKAYDVFVAKHGAFFTQANRHLFQEDPDAALLLALENWDNDKKKATKTKIFTERTQFPVKVIEKADSPADAVAISMSEKGQIDLEYISRLLGVDEAAVTQEIQGYAFENPETGQWEAALYYLAGNVRKKLEAATAAAQMDPKYQPNIEALKAVQPEDLLPTDIAVRLGSPWIDGDTYAAFVRHLCGYAHVKFTQLPHDGSWIVSGQATSGRWDTPDFDTSELVAKAMNFKEPTVWGKDSQGNRYVEKERTTIARVMQQRIKDEFDRWIWADVDRATQLARVYNDLFNNTVLPQWDGSYLTCPGQSSTPLQGGKLRPHQANVVARFMIGGNTLMAHAVGAGKTYAGVTMAMEGRRIGHIKKPIFVVPNHKIDDWRVDWMKLYPSANILAATKDDFKPERRATLMNRIATGDWDGVIVPMSSFEKIPMSPDRVRTFFQGQIDELEMEIQALAHERGRDSKNIVKRLEKAKAALQEKLKRQEATWKKDKGPYFDELGIDMMLVDESQAFKNLFFVTKMDRVSGLQVSQTQRSFDMYLKTQYINEITRHRGLVFATGTPITNTIGEMFTVQRYLQPQTLKEAGIQAFDFWAKTFGDTVTDVEVDPTGGGFRLNTRFVRFTNLPELMQMFRSVADVVTKKQMKIPLPKLKGGKPITIQTEPTPEVQDYINQLVHRAEHIRAGHVKPKEDNMLKVTNDGRHVALDARLRIKGAPDLPGSKVNRCVAEVHRIYKETAKDKALQVIWCDLSTPKKGQWSIYNEIKQKLVAKGVKADEIAFIHDAADEKQQATLYQKANAGRIRVLLASTGKMGTGANVQERLIAAHHLTAPWVPAEVEQRDGRMERQGNMFEEVQKYEYVTKGTFDAYMWQTLETKAKFIEQVMTGDSTGREIEDISKGSLTYAEVKALASGNPKILDAVRLDAEVKKLQAEEKAHKADQFRIQREVKATLPSKIKAGVQLVKDTQADMESAKAAIEAAGEGTDITIGKTHYAKRKDAADALDARLKEVNKLEAGTTHLGSAYGFYMEVHWATGFGEGQSGGWWRVLLRGSAFHYNVDLGDSPAGNITRIENAVASIEDRYKQAAATLERDRRRMAELEGVSDQPFPKAQELADKRAKLTQLQNEIGLDAKHNQPPQTIAEDEDEGGDTGGDPTLDVPSPSGGFVGLGRPPATAQISAIAQETIDTGNEQAESFMKRTRGFRRPNAAVSGPFWRGLQWVRQFVREFHYLPELPKTEAYAEIREAFRYTQEIKKNALRWTMERIQAATAPLAGIKAEVNKRREALYLKVIADDLMEDLDKGVALPRDMDEAAVRAMKDEADRLFNKYPSVRQAYEQIRATCQELTDRMVAKGWMEAEKAREFYYPHKVIKYLRQNDGFFGVGQKPAIPRKGYLKHRKGGADYSTDVLDRLAEHWAQVRRDLDMTDFLETTLFKEYEKFREDNPEWKPGDGVPAGYREVEVLPGRFYYQAFGVTQEMAKALTQGNLQMIETALEKAGKKLSPAVRNVLAVGKKRSYIVREAVAKQLESMPTMPVSTNAAYLAIKSLNAAVKKQVLFNPLYAVPFHVTNYIGDAHRVATGAPGALNPKYIVEFIQESNKARRGESVSDRFDTARRYGVIGSGFFVGDITGSEAAIPIIAKMDISPASAVFIQQLKTVWSAMEKLGAGREDVLRYATYAYLLDQAQAGTNIMRFAVKDAAVARGLQDVQQKAANIARNLCGDYSAIGNSGRLLADTVAPFYRWMHLNLPWWPRMIAEYARRGEAGRLMAAVMAASAPYIIAQIWNNMDPDRRKYERQLPPWRRWNFHLVKPGGGTAYVNLGTDDLANFLGVPESALDFQRYSRGMITMPELVGRIMLNLGEGAGSTAINAVGGVAGVARDLAGLQTYPSVKQYLDPSWRRRGLKALSTATGAYGQTATAISDLVVDKGKLAEMPEGEERQKLQKQIDRDAEKLRMLMYRGIFGIRGYDVDVDRTLDQFQETFYKRTAVVQGQLKFEGETKKGQERRSQELQIQLEPLGIKPPEPPSIQDLLGMLAGSTTRSGQLNKGSEVRVQGLQAEYQRRTGQAPSLGEILQAGREAARRKRLEQRNENSQGKVDK